MPTTTRPTAAPAPWHALPAEDALRALGSGTQGLDAAEVERRRRAHGLNRLPAAPPRHPLRRLLAQVHHLLIYVLLGAAVVAYLIGDTPDALVILAVVAVNAVIGYVQEGRAEQALAAIRGMVDPRASVVRDGRRVAVAAQDLAPGDLVLLEAGDRVPADLRLVRARGLRIQEAVLTGESLPVEKSTAATAADAALGDRAGMAYSGTLVAAGQGAGVAVATGAATELGRIGTLLGEIETLKTPLTRQMDRFARTLTFAILGVAAAVFLFAVAVRGYALADAFMAVVGLTVAAIPEGLPAVMTIALAIGVRRMAARNAIIRRLPAVETLGSVSVICSDKTGTLTRNEMTVQSIATADAQFEVGGVGYEPRGAFRVGDRDIDPLQDAALAELLRAALLCNDAELRHADGQWTVAGDPMEGALVSAAAKAGLDAGLLRRQLPRTDEIPFDAQHRFMATLHHSHEDGAFVCLKGAPERIAQMCAARRGAQGEQPLDAAYWQARTERMAALGQRVLAVAVLRVPADRQTLSFADVERGATLLGLLGLIDPPREEAIAAVRDCRAAGIAVKMITGDHAVTAGAIARQLGLGEAPAVAGTRLDALDEDGLRAAARTTAVFARTSPEHKLRLVQALQAEGAVVAMTGDGVNDAPALKRADVGVAMGGKGTEAAKEASEMVLADDNFASIVAAVREGRTVYDNLKKVIGWTLPTNGGEALAIVAAILLGLTLPVTPIQILWVNMITAVTLGLTLAFEPTEPGTMRRPPRAPDEALLSGLLLWRVAFVSLLVVGGAFGIFYWSLARGQPVEVARTLVVNAMVAMEVFYLFSVRYVHGTALTWRGALGTRPVLIGVGVVAAAQFALTYLPPLQAVFDTRAVTVPEGLAVIGVGAALLLAAEAEKWVQRRWAARR